MESARHAILDSSGLIKIGIAVIAGGSCIDICLRLQDSEKIKRTKEHHTLMLIRGSYVMRKKTFYLATTQTHHVIKSKLL